MAKKARQTEIGLKGEGVERPSHPAVDAAAEVYEKDRDKRMKQSKAEKASKENLIKEMRKAGQTTYRDDNADPPIVITLSSKDDVKVTRLSAEDEEPEEDDDKAA